MSERFGVPRCCCGTQPQCGCYDFLHPRLTFTLTFTNRIANPQTGSTFYTSAQKVVTIPPTAQCGNVESNCPYDAGFNILPGCTKVMDTFAGQCGQGFGTFNYLWYSVGLLCDEQCLACGCRKYQAQFAFSRQSAFSGFLWQSGLRTANNGCTYSPILLEFGPYIFDNRTNRISCVPYYAEIYLTVTA